MNFNILTMTIRFHEKSVGFIVLVFFVCCNSLTHGQASKVGIALTQFENETQGTDNEVTTPTNVSVELEDSTTEDTQTSLESSTVETDPDDKNTNPMNVSVEWKSSTTMESNTSRDSTTVDDEIDTNNEVTTPMNVSVETENSTDSSHTSQESSTVAIDVATVTESIFEKSTTKSSTIRLSSEIQPTDEVTSTMNVSMETEYATTSDLETSYGSQSEGTEIVGTTIADNNDNSFSVSTISLSTTTTELMVTANSSRCPVVILSPGFVSTDFGTSAQFRAIVESYHDPALESRWLRLRSSVTETIDINHPKYSGSKNLPSPELLINNVTFEDEINYQLQVRIVGGWCFGNTVSLDVRGILQFYDPCNATKECDQRKDLVCSSVHNSCMCHSNYYHRNRTCYLRSNLRAVYSNSQITTSNITVWWNHPYQDADLVQSYNVSLRERSNSYNYKASVELQTNYTFESSFSPSFLYFFEITSNVLLSDPEKTFTVKTNTINLVVDPNPPGPIDTNASNFHPQTLYLKWAGSENSSYVNMYQVIIDRSSILSSSISLIWHRDLEPGRNYTVQIYAICWYYNNYSTWSPVYNGVIQTLRVPKVTLPRSSYTIPFLSNFEMVASVLNVSDFPPTTSTKWQRYSQYININNTRYNGSTEELVYPTLVINKVDFDNDHGAEYRCVATNSEGSWTSSNTRLYLIGSLNFLETCTRSAECISGKYLSCQQSTCLCYSWYYHKNRTCYPDYLLRVNMQEIDNDTCEAVLRWSHPTVDLDLITNYIIRRYSLHNNSWVVEEMVSVGTVTQYSTKCTLLPGRLYMFSISPIASLTDPDKTFEVISTSRTIIMGEN
nr:uncharacterized protein LOC109617378 [Crassostrea gigas]